VKGRKAIEASKILHRTPDVEERTGVRHATSSAADVSNRPSVHSVPRSMH
jgi:hypothetical protein